MGTSHFFFCFPQIILEFYLNTAQGDLWGQSLPKAKTLTVSSSPVVLVKKLTVIVPTLEDLKEKSEEKKFFFFFFPDTYSAEVRLSFPSCSVS